MISTLLGFGVSSRMTSRGSGLEGNNNLHCAVGIVSIALVGALDGFTIFVDLFFITLDFSINPISVDFYSTDCCQLMGRQSVSFNGVPAVIWVPKCSVVNS